MDTPTCIPAFWSLLLFLAFFQSGLHRVKVCTADESDHGHASDSSGTSFQDVSVVVEEDISPAPHLRGLNEEQERLLTKTKKNNGWKQEVENIWVAIGNDMDTDPTNEIQNISSDGNNIYLSRNGGTIPLPTGPPGPKGMFILK